MDASSPLVTDALRLFHLDLHEHLCEAESLATGAGEWSWEDIDAARKLIPDLVTVIRGLLVEHEPGPGAGCRTCPSAWPCPVVTSINALVKDPDREFVALLRQANEER